MVELTGVKVGGLEVTINALCPDEAPRFGLSTWSLEPVQDKEDARKHPVLVGALCKVLQDMGVHKGFAPRVAPASARIIDNRDLSEKIRLSENIFLHRNKAVPADGCFIGTGYAFVMSGAGCPLIVAVAGDQMCIAHAGRESLVARETVMSKVPPEKRRNERPSIVKAIVDAFKERGAPINDLTMRMMFSIPANFFEHSFYDSNAQYHRALWEFVREKWPESVKMKGGGAFILDLERLFEIQAREAGVRNVLTTHSLAEFPRLAHTRDGQSSDRRNLFIVKRSQMMAS